MPEPLILKTHYYSDMGVRCVEVVSAPKEIRLSLFVLVRSESSRLHMIGPDVIAFGTGGFGVGRVYYRIVGWQDRCLVAELLTLGFTPTLET